MADKNATALSTEDLGADTVVAYLRRHPDFLTEHQELIDLLTPPERQHGQGVLDMQLFMVERLRDRVRALEGSTARLEAVGEANLASQSRVQTAALTLLAARSFEHLIDTVASRLPDLLEIEASSLCVENGEPLPGKGGTVGIRVLKPGALDRIVGKGRDILLAADVQGSRTLFGPDAPRVRSVALARLSFGPLTPPGLLALGSARPDGYAPGQGTELLSFFARIVEHCIRRWLSLSP